MITECWKCGEVAKEKPCGYFLCTNCGMWSLPLDVWEARREKAKQENIDIQNNVNIYKDK